MRPPNGGRMEIIMVKIRDAVLNFIKTKKALILSVLLITALFSGVALTNLVATAELGEKGVITLDESHLKNDETSSIVEYSYNFGYDISAADEEGRTIYKTINNDPQIYMHVGNNAGFINTIKISFKSLENYGAFQLYYLAPGEKELSEVNSRMGGLCEDEKSCLAIIPMTDIRALRFDISGTFVLDKIELSCVEDVSVYRELSIPALVLLIISLALIGVLFIFEKQLGYLSFIKAVFVKRYDFLKSAIKEGRRAAFVIRILLYTAVAAFTVTLLILTAISKYSAGVAMIIMLLGTISAAMFIADKAISRDLKPAVLFLVLFIILGVTLSYIKPPSIGGGWDEAIHYRYATEFKNAVLGGEYTLADVNCENNVHYYNRYGKDGQNYFNTLIYEDGIKLAPNPLEITVYKGLAYFPTAFVTVVAEALGADIIKTLFLSKTVNVFVYALVLYFGMRRLKSGGLIFAAAAMMPTAVFISTTINYDYWVTAFIGGAFMYFIALLQDRDRTVTVRDWVAILVMFFLGCGSKAVYCILILPFFFAPKDRFKDKKQMKYSRLAVCATLLIIALIMLLPFLADTSIMTDERGNVEGMATDAGEQVKYILTNPLKYTVILVEFVLEYLSLGNANLYSGAFLPYGYASSYIGTISILLIVITVILDRSEKDVFKGSRVLKLSSIAAFLGSVVLVATSLYISFTPVGYEAINGVQYRYILPALPMLLYAAGSGRLIKSFNKNILTVAVFSLLALTIAASSYELFIEGWLEWAIYDGGTIPF